MLTVRMSSCRACSRGPHLQHCRVCKGGTAGGRQWHRLVSLAAARCCDAASSTTAARQTARSVTRRERPVVILCAPAVPGLPVVSGHRDTHTGRALIVGDALEPLPCATLGAGVQRGMVHRDQLRGRSRRLMRCHREQDAPLETSGISVDLSGTRRCRVRWSPSTARVPPHERAAWRLVWDSLAANRRLVSPNPRAPRPAAPPPRLW
jgi:hypothetical protein